MEHSASRQGRGRSRGRSGLRTTVTAAAVLASVVTATGTGFGAERGKAVEAAAGGFDVSDDNVVMSYQPDTKALKGTTTITATATTALDGFALNINGPTVRSVMVDSVAATFTRTGEKDLTIMPGTAIPRGARFQVRVAYDGVPGPMWLATRSGGATAFEGRDSDWFPVHEDANDRADFHLTATVPSGWSVVSIGREGPETHVAATSTFNWTEPNVDPGAIAVSIDRFTLDRSTLSDGTPVVNAYGPGLAESTRPLGDRLPEILNFLSNAFGPYPFDAAGNVFVDVSGDPPFTSPQTRPVLLDAGSKEYMTIDADVHEQTHQWWGVSAAAASGEDDCLAECFAVYATWMWDEAEDGADLDARYREQVTANKDDTDLWGALYRPGQSPGINEYTKGPLALHALRRQIGDTAFDRLLKQWPQRYRSAYVTWPQFEALAEHVSGRDLTGFFQAWFRDSTVPADAYLWPGALKP